MRFERKYNEEFRDKRDRDRFPVEFGKTDKLTRSEFNEAKVFLRTSMDATAIKQLATYGWLVISNPTQATAYLIQSVFINEKGNENLGKDVRTEIEAKFRDKMLKMGGKRKPRGVPSD